MTALFWSFGISNILVIFKTLISKSNNIAIKKKTEYQRYDAFQSSHGIKTFRASCINNIDTRKVFLQSLLLKVCDCFLFRKSRNSRCRLWSVLIFPAFLETKRS